MKTAQQQRGVIVLIMIITLMAGCATGADDVDDATAPTEAATDAAAAAPDREPQEVADASGCRPDDPARDNRPVVEIIAVEYAFQGVPDSVEPGTELCLYNAGDEVHDMVVHYVADETAPAEELVPPEGVQIGIVGAPPGEYGLALDPRDEVIVVEPLILDKPGRYMLYSVVGEGTDAAAFSEFVAAAEEAGELVDGPPFSRGEPDFMKGMYADLTVEGEVPDDSDLVLQVLERDGRFAMFHDLLVDAALPHFEGFMQDPEWDLTLLAPTDEALSALPDGVMEQLRGDPELLTRVLDYHILVDYLLIEDVETGTIGTVGNVGPVPVTVEGDTVSFDGAEVVEANIEASNAVVHAIDELLIPDGVQLEVE